MATLDSLILSDTTLMLSDNGESAKFRAKGVATADALDITILINRNDSSPIPGAINGFAPYADIWIKCHATEGATSITRGGDDVYFAPRQGGTPGWYSITEIVAQEAGFWHVRAYHGNR